MSEKQTNFRKLSEAVIFELKALGYKASTLTNYRRLYALIGTFMNDCSIENYSSEVGKDFVTKHYPADNQRRRTILLMIRRLDDYVSNIPYRCHHAMKADDVPAEFAQLLDDYLAYCAGIGNKPGTVEIKKGFYLIFLHFLSDIGCKDISEVTADAVAKSCLIYINKDRYAALRQFLRYLFEKGLISKDLSVIVPHYKHRQILPSVFTPKEIRKIEETIDCDTLKGKRDLAVLLLVTRMGLRSGDIAKLKLSSIDFSSSHIDLIQQKTGEPLSVFMPQDVSSALTAHIENAAGNLSDGYVFHGMKAPYGRLTASIIRHIVHTA